MLPLGPVQAARLQLPWTVWNPKAGRLHTPAREGSGQVYRAREGFQRSISLSGSKVADSFTGAVCPSTKA